MKPIFCGNLEFDTRQSDVERLFKRYGKVDRVDLKSGLLGKSMIFLDGCAPLHFPSSMCPGFTISCFHRKYQSYPPWHHHPTFLEPMAGFAFIYMDDERDAEDAIRRLDRTEFGRKGRQIRVEWTKEERGNRSGGSRRSSVNTKLSKTLFVINFDPIHTRTRDLERHFDQYGKILNIRVRRNFAFIQFETQEDATRALEATNMSKFMDRVITVEYAIRDDDEKRNGRSPDRRGRNMSPEKRSYDRRQSPSPHRRDRASPDYGRGANPNFRPDRRGSPRYDRAESPGSPKYNRVESPGRSPKYDRAERYHSRSSSPRERSRS